ncbi:hypothetical protein ENSA5_47900 [Enhygromyxa salina]|uniref:PepSY-associated TM helix n=1 Tax=Enhygromyxa salina TaxID=215803 RepID=A0A2S9XIA3_9BACT|nr:PepSY-associated TM helix domain-containing protein [Enhygromyxa salina]PRP92609.1 hypothetical protein ENSA5_47900 [Enhygromyxa salina]
MSTESRGPRRGRRALVVVLTGALACLGSWLIARSWPAPAVERATLASLAFVPLWSGLALAGLALLRRAPQRRSPRSESSRDSARSRPARPGHGRRSLFALHRSLGGTLAVVAILVFGSGVGAVLDRALASWQLRADATQAVAPASDQALDEALAELLRQHPELGAGDLALHPAGAGHPWIQADFFDSDRELVRVELDPETGAERGRGQGPLWILRELHRRLLIQPVLGELALGVVGFGLGLVLLSGLATRRWLRPRTRAATHKRAPLTMRAHQWLGLGLLPVATLWAWTGALLGLTLIIVPIVGGAAYGGDRNALMHEVLAVDRPPLDEGSATLAPTRLRELVASGACPAIREQLPDAELHRILIHHPTQASARIRVDLEGRGLLARASFTVDASGELLDCRSLPRAGIGLQSFMASVALHYGEWDTPGLSRRVVDGAYLLLGAGLVALAWLGGCLLARRRARDGDARGALYLRRTLSCAGLGLAALVVGLALLSRIPGLARSEPAALLSAGLISGAVVLWMFTGDLSSRRRGLLFALAIGLGLIPLLGYFVADVAPTSVDVLAALAGIGLGLLGRRS